jgi:cytochrome P450 PksS
MNSLKMDRVDTLKLPLTDLEKVNLSLPEFKANPFPYYRQLRDEAPVIRVEYKGIREPAWLITRYDDVVAALKDDQHFIKNVRNAKSSDQLKREPWVPPMFRALSSNLLDVDGDQHRRLRGLIHKAFTPSMIEHMRGRVQDVSNELIDAALSKGQMDLINDYAHSVVYHLGYSWHSHCRQRQISPLVKAGGVCHREKQYHSSFACHDGDDRLPAQESERTSCRS